MGSRNPESHPGRTGRIPAIDLARTAAIVAMALFHLGRDLDMYGVTPPGSSYGAGWFWAARLIAGSFLFLVGIGLWLGHGRGVRWGPFLRRLAMVAAGAALVSAGTYLAVPQAWVRYGILHSITVSSVIALAFLRLPAPITALAGIGALLLPRWVALEAPPLFWTGLAAPVPPQVDFEPLFPWLAPVLLGLAAAKAADRAGWLDRLRDPNPPRWLDRLAWPGRHSLAIYLLHQPILVGLVLGWRALAG